jgi:hypothetical protein
VQLTVSATITAPLGATVTPRGFLNFADKEPPSAKALVLPANVVVSPMNQKHFDCDGVHWHWDHKAGTGCFATRRTIWLHQSNSVVLLQNSQSQ